MNKDHKKHHFCSGHILLSNIMKKTLNFQSFSDFRVAKSSRKRIP